MKITINQKNVGALPFAKDQACLYLDDSLIGFGIRVGKKKKAFYAEKRVQGRPVRVTLGEFPLMSAEEARKAALSSLAQMAKGVDLNRKKNLGLQFSIPLRSVCQEYLAKRPLKPRTRQDVRVVLGSYLQDWLDLPLCEISKAMVSDRHAEISRRSSAQANLCMRYLQAIFNFARAQYEFPGGELINPVLVLTETKTWNKRKRRQTVIPKARLGRWFRAALELREQKHYQVPYDFVLTLLLTGLRKGEASQLRWSDVDLENKCLTIPEKMTKNLQTHRLPLSSFLWDLLKKRCATRKNDLVFANKKGEPLETAWYSLKLIEKECGVKCCHHDLRRTFASIAESIGIDGYKLKRLLNHSIIHDVTGGYIVAAYDIEGLRESVQQITDFVLQQADESAPE